MVLVKEDRVAQDRQKNLTLSIMKKYNDVSRCYVTVAIAA
jgi:hypothetical protein